jgi:hypothetical protein
MLHSLHKRLAVFAGLLSLLFVQSPAWAYGQATLAESFEDLQTRVKVGDRLEIKTTDGHEVSGKLVWIGGDDIEIERARWFRTRKYEFPESSVSRIRVIDSTWNGELIGLAVGAAAVGIPCAVAPADRLSDEGMACFGLVLVPLLGLGIGGWIDSAFNRVVYEARGGTRTTVLPLIEPHRIGLVARMSF